MKKGDKFTVDYRPEQIFVADKVGKKTVFSECGEQFGLGDCEVVDKKPTEFTFYMGNTKIITSNINELKEQVCEISEKLGAGEEHSKHISDFIYDVESTYQQFHGLDEDNWDIVH